MFRLRRKRALAMRAYWFQFRAFWLVVAGVSVLGGVISDFAAYSCTFNARASGTCLMRWTCASATARYVANPMAITSTMAAVGT